MAFFLFNSVVSLISELASICAAVNFHGRNLSDDADVSRKVENQNHSSSFSGRSSSGFRGRILSSFDRTAFGIYHTIDFGGHGFIIFPVYDRCKKIADKKKGQEIPLSEWLAVILIPGISIFFSAIALDQCRDEKAAFLGGLCMVFLNLAVFYLLEHLKQLQQNPLELSLLEQENRAYENRAAGTVGNGRLYEITSS